MQERQQDFDAARNSYLLSSDCLFKAAEQSKGKMKEIRLANAEKILKRAKEIEAGVRKEQNHQKSEASDKEKNG